MKKNKKYFSENHHYSRLYYQKRDLLILPPAIILKSYLKDQKVSKILEVGCGTGRLIEYLKYFGFKVQGCDKSFIAAKISGQKKASATKLPFNNNQFQAVLAISLIEHLTQKEGLKFIQEAFRVLKKGGIFFLVTPNYWSPNRLIRGKKWFAFSDPTHLTYYSPLNLASLLKKQGFSQFRFWFKIPTSPRFSCPFFSLAGKNLPNLITDFITFIFYSTPFALIRESFWLSGRKKSNLNE